jgi:1-acyl-sn-glycerol-3-phosphate acyltransferase
MCAVLRVGVRLLAWKSRAFPVVRNTPDRAALRTALSVPADGHVLLVYPEGTRSWDGNAVGAAAIMMGRVIALLPRERSPVGAETLTLGGSSPAA